MVNVPALGAASAHAGAAKRRLRPISPPPHRRIITLDVLFVLETRTTRTLPILAPAFVSDETVVRNGSKAIIDKRAASGIERPSL
jgi:hypothetical protein